MRTPANQPGVAHRNCGTLVHANTHPETRGTMPIVLACIVGHGGPNVGNSRRQAAEGHRRLGVEGLEVGPLRTSAALPALALVTQQTACSPRSPWLKPCPLSSRNTFSTHLWMACQTTFTLRKSLTSQKSVKVFYPGGPILLLGNLVDIQPRSQTTRHGHGGRWSR